MLPPPFVSRSGFAARSAVVAVAALASASASASGCSFFDPETGERRPACNDADSNPSVTVDFKTQIRPLMSGADPNTRGCGFCHYANADGSKEGFFATGLDLQTLQAIRRGGRQTPPERIVVPGKPCSSAVVQKLQGTFGGARMPKDGPYWSPEQIQLVIDWIAEGANGGDAD